MKYTCIIIEDEINAQKLLEHYLLESPHQIEILEKFTNVKDALPIIRKGMVDILFLDIHLPFMSGIDFVKENKLSCKVIFCTSYNTYAISAFDLDANDYIVKPFTPKRINQALNKTILVLELERKTKGTLDNSKIYPLKDGTHIVNLLFSDIVYIKSELNYIEIITTEKKYIERNSLKKIKACLPNDFMQIHKSYIINIKYVLRYHFKEIELLNQIQIPVGRVFRKELKDRLLKQ